MPTPLWTLLYLIFRAAFRRVARQAKTVRGALLVVVGVGMICVWIGPTVWANRRVPPADPAAILTVGPVAVLGLCLLNVLTSAGERAVTFSPAEVDFLFPGPFTRRQLLVYKLVKTGGMTALSSLVLGLTLGRFGGSFLARAVGAWLTLQFVQLVAMVAALARSTIGERAFSGGRRGAVVLLAVAAVAVIVPAVARQQSLQPTALAARLNDTRTGRAVLAPFGVFVHVVTARHLATDGAKWAAVAVAIDGALVGVVVLLDANYLETAATASGRRYNRIARVRQGGLAGMSSASSARVKVPMLPWLGGAGPVAWRQLTGVGRTATGLLLVLGVVALAVGGAVGHADASASSVRALLTLSIGMNLFLTSLLKFDFRGDLDQLDGLRALPVRPSAVAAAELVAPTVVLSIVNALLLAAVAARGRLPAQWLLWVALFAVPVNALLVASENLIFLVFPYRPTSAVAGDMGMVGRQTVVFLCRLVMLAIVATAAAAAGAAAYALLGRSVVAGAAVAWAVLVAAIAVAVAVIGWVFGRFDPSVDTPT